MTDAEPADANLEAEDRKTDLRALLVIFAALVLGAVHFMSGWTFDL